MFEAILFHLNPCEMYTVTFKSNFFYIGLLQHDLGQCALSIRLYKKVKDIKYGNTGAICSVF